MVYLRVRLVFRIHPRAWNFRYVLQVTYSTILETYSLEEILELNDLTPEDCLEFLVDEGFVELPEIKPLDFE